jgi:hypothetical protein
MEKMTQLRIFCLVLILLLVLCSQASSQAETRPLAGSSVNADQSSELTDMKADLAKMQSSLNQMQAVFALVGNPTLPANHELQLNIDMWRILINQMQRRVDRMERMQVGPPKL